MREIKREVRKLERRYIKNRKTINFDIFRNKCRAYKNLLDSAKTEFYCEKFGNCDSKKLFLLVKNLSVAANEHILPGLNSKQTLANRFSSFFMEKIDSLRRDLVDPNIVSYTEFPAILCPSRLSDFNVLNLEEVRELLRKSPTKFYTMDPIPTSILKQCLDVLAGLITNIINNSMCHALFPSKLKLALVIPSIKKTSLNFNELASYRPIANLPFL